MSISKTLGFPRATVIRTIQNFLERKGLATQPRSGRPKLLNFEHKRILKRVVKQNNKKSTEQIKICLVKEPDLMFLLKLLGEIYMNLNFSLAFRSKPLLTDRQRENRLNWCIERKNWSI